MAMFFAPFGRDFNHRDQGPAKFRKLILYFLGLLIKDRLGDNTLIYELSQLRIQ